MRYLLPTPVVDYIEQHGLYLDDAVGMTPNPEKGKEKESSGSTPKKEIYLGNSVAGAAGAFLCVTSQISSSPLVIEETS